MAEPYDVRLARVDDAESLGRVHTQVWHEAYAAVMPAQYLDDLDPQRSAQRWRLRLEVDEPEAVVVVATDSHEQIVGFAAAGATRDEGAPAAWELYAINVVAEHHGTGVADALLAAALGDRAASLWVLKENPRAQSFYARCHFVADGGSKVHEETGLPEIRMTRAPRPPDSGGASLAPSHWAV